MTWQMWQGQHETLWVKIIYDSSETELKENQMKMQKKNATYIIVTHNLTGYIGEEINRNILQ